MTSNFVLVHSCLKYPPHPTPKMLTWNYPIQFKPTCLWHLKSNCKKHCSVTHCLNCSPGVDFGISTSQISSFLLFFFFFLLIYFTWILSPEPHTCQANAILLNIPQHTQYLQELVPNNLVGVNLAIKIFLRRYLCSQHSSKISVTVHFPH